MGIKTISLIGLLLPSLALAQVLTPATGRIAPIAPIVPTVISKTVVAPVVPVKPISQRLTQTEDGTFTITPAQQLPQVLPESNPLPNTSLNISDIQNQLFGKTSTLDRSTVARSAVVKPNIPSIEAPEGASLKARVVKLEDGTQTLQLRGTSQGSPLRLIRIEAPDIATVTVPQTAKPSLASPVPPAPTPPVAKPKKPQPRTQSIRLTYFADDTIPENATKIENTLNTLPTVKPTHMLVIAQSPPPVLDALEKLPKYRWNWLNKKFEGLDRPLDGIKTSEILLTHTSPAFLNVELTFPPL